MSPESVFCRNRELNITIIIIVTTIIIIIIIINAFLMVRFPL